MQGLDNLAKRLNYNGGFSQHDRMVNHKLRTLKKALLYSYQSYTIINKDGKEFRALLNIDKTKPDYDYKILSIPFEDICLAKVIKDENGEYQEVCEEPKGKTSLNLEPTNIKSGDVFYCKGKGMDCFWLVCMEDRNEKAYFRAGCYLCEESVIIDGQKYYIYIRGPVETVIDWRQKAGVEYNDLNYSEIIYITKNESTLNFFHRFAKIKIAGKTWEVQAVDPYNMDGVIEVALSEWYENEMAELPPKDELKIESKIIGAREVYPYEIYDYRLDESVTENGKWELSNKKAKILNFDDRTVKIQIVTGRSGEVILKYNDSTILPLAIKSI